jgi:hypothetical protein
MLKLAIGGNLAAYWRLPKKENPTYEITAPIRFQNPAVDFPPRHQYPFLH